MKRPAHILILTHVMLAGLGAWLALRSRPDVPPSPMVATISIPHPPVAAAAGKTCLPSKIALASPAAWRAAWEQALLGPRDRSGELMMPDDIGFFMDWSEVDPEGAIRGLAKTYAPHFAHNYIGNAIGRNGAILAPALVKHYRELKLMGDFEVHDYMGRALNKLAKDDPAQAGSLLASLPPGVRSDVYRRVFDQQDRKSLDQLYAAMPASTNPSEAGRRTEAYAAAVDAADPEHGVWTGMVEASDPALRNAFATEGVRKALKGENWSGFFDTVEQLGPAARDEAREAMQSQLPSGAFTEKARASISEECRRRGLDDWTQKPR